jgi:hypothetical protein
VAGMKPTLQGWKKPDFFLNPAQCFFGFFGVFFGFFRGFLGVFWDFFVFFLNIFAQKREFLGFFSVSRILLGASRL